MPKRQVYLDAAATTPLLPEVYEAMRPYWSQNFGNPNSLHTWGREARVAVEEARRTIGTQIGAQPDELIFTASATEAANTIIYGLVSARHVKSLIVSRVEHHCVLEPAQFAHHHWQIPLAYIHNDKLGHIDLNHLEELLKTLPRPALVCVIHANNEIATIHDPQPIAQLVHQYDGFLFMDMVQTFGHYAINLSELPIDYTIASAHKFHGPKGVGFLYVRKGKPVPILLRGGAQERQFRAGTENVPGIIGMATALQTVLNHLTHHQQHIQNLRQYLRDQLKTLFPDIQFNGDASDQGLYTVLNVCFPPHPAGEMLLLRLDIEGIAASAGSACSSGAHQRSHVLEAIGAPADRPSIRFSFSHLNTRDELDYLLEVLKRIYAEVHTPTT